MPLNVVYQPPRLPQQHLPRPRLSKALLDSTARVKLVCAPAGTGKTVLLTECLQQLDKHSAICWLRSTNNVGSAQALSMQIANALQLDNDVDLIDALSNFTAPLHLVIDDFSPAIDEQIDALLARLVALSSPHIQWWISCRRPLTNKFSRLILEETAYELSDSAQLSFTATEVSALFALKNLDLSGKQLAFIMQHSAGWCIAVKALLADPELIHLSTWPSNFTHYINSELFSQFSAQQHEYWLLLAHLQNFNASLVAYILETDEKSCEQQFSAFVSAGVFIERQHTSSGWFNVFPPLAYYVRSQPHATAHRWHLRASQWYASQGNWQAAVEHALRAGHDEEALSMLQEISDEESMSGENVAVLMQLKNSPAQDILFSTPRLISLITGAQVFTGQLDSAQQSLGHLANFLPQPTAKLQADLLAQWQAFTGWIAHLSGNSELAQEHLHAALQWLSDDFWEIRLTCYSALTQHALLIGDLDLARSLNRTALRLSRQQKSVLFEAYLELDHAQLLEHRGSFTDAENILEKACALLGEDHTIKSPILGRLKLRLGQLKIRQNNKIQAHDYFTEGLQEALRWGDHRGVYGYFGLALLDVEDKNYNSALERLRDAERSMQKNHIPESLYRAALLFTGSIIVLHQGKYIAAQTALSNILEHYDSQGKHTAPPASFELLPRIKLYLAMTYLLQHKLEPALALIKQVLDYAEQHGFLGLLAQTHSVLFLQQHMQETDLPCTHAQSEHILNPCLKSGLLQAATELQALFAHQFQDNISQEALLSPREQEVLQWVAKGLASKQIAEHMHISVHTVKAHIQRIYKKLDVSRRTQAVAKAETLGLLIRH
jgi:ATP/maltotriose-dependent transcriptional regulator MalT